MAAAGQRNRLTPDCLVANFAKCPAHRRHRRRRRNRRVRSLGLAGAGASPAGLRYGLRPAMIPASRRRLPPTPGRAEFQGPTISSASPRLPAAVIDSPPGRQRFCRRDGPDRHEGCRTSWSLTLSKPPAVPHPPPHNWWRHEPTRCQSRPRVASPGSRWSPPSLGLAPSAATMRNRCLGGQRRPAHEGSAVSASRALRPDRHRDQLTRSRRPVGRRAARQRGTRPPAASAARTRSRSHRPAGQAEDG